MMGRALAPIEVALGTWKQLAAARQGIARLRDVLASTAASSVPSVVLPRPRRELSVRDLTVAAPGTERTIISNVSFSLTAGMGLALLGASASGKTSLTKALVGVWPAIGGAVRLDGAALHQWNHDDLGRHIGYLPQDVALFDGTVAENIARFDDAAGSDAILQAAQAAGAHEMIVRLPDGYSTRIGEGGMSLSAGQRQRLGLARAVFGSPFLVVLDEPNANLDADGEAALTRAIERLRQAGCIVIVVSHRASALSALNVASVMYDGRMIAFGPREEIFARVAPAARRPATVSPIPTKAGIPSTAGAAP
jgi:ABC-type protease/lipase transport system fused ATPase/permease subunit